MLGIVAVDVVRESRIFFRAPMYRAHCAVIFAIAQLSCLSKELTNTFEWYHLLPATASLSPKLGVHSPH